MPFKSHTTRRAALLASSASMILAGMMSAAAQDADDDEELDLEEVVVTGSRIARPNVTSSSPVTVLESEAFDILGTVDTIDLVNTLPQAFVAQDSSFANGANGTSTLNLRGLGAIRTLVLANGKRLPYGSPTAGGIPSDINLIPAQLVERVEIVTGGASAVYGSDAIGGVANFILKKDFEGIEIDALYGYNWSQNGRDDALEWLTNQGIDPVTGSVSDNDTVDISGVMGANFDDGRGNVTAYFRFLESEGAQQGNRDFAQCALGEFGFDAPFCLGSGQGPFPTSFVIGRQTDANGDPIQLLNFDGSPLTNASGDPIFNRTYALQQDGSIGDVNNAFNFNPFNPIRRAIERVNAGFTGHYNVTDDIEAYMDFGYTRSNSPQIIAPSAAFGNAINQVGCDNPLLTPDMLISICGTQDANGQFSRDPDGDGFAQVEVRRRFVEGGPRTDDRTLSNFRFVYGLRGQIDDNWEFDVFGQMGRTELNRIQTNQVTAQAMGRALDIVADPTTGAPVCRSVVDGTDPSCIAFITAYDPNGTNAPGLAAYIDTPILTTGEIQQTVWGGTVSGDLTDSGFVSPFAEDGVAILFGTEFRRDSLRTQADGINATPGALVGAGGAVLPTNGRTEVYEFFTEAQFPLVQGKEFAKELTATVAYRRSEYGSTDVLNGGIEGGDFGTDSYAFGLSWTPIEDIRFRAQYQRAIRAPNIGELFLPVNSGLSSLSDPCAGGPGFSQQPTATAAQCANTGLPTALFGSVPEDSGQLNVLTGGNPNLNPETSDTFTLGFVFQPNYVPGLTVTVDYFNIEISDLIASVPATFTLDGCLETGDAAFCNNINRAPNGSLTSLPREQFNIVANSQNIGGRSTQGLDFQVNYALSFDDWGDLNLNYTSSLILEWLDTPVTGFGTFDCVGLFDEGCGNPTFDYRHIVTAQWQTPWDVAVAANWRYFSEVERIDSIESLTGEVTTFSQVGNGELVSAFLETQSYFDLTVFWDVTENIQLRVGARNVFDNDPPVLPAFGPSPSANVEANTVAGVYDANGRFVFAGVNFRF